MENCPTEEKSLGKVSGKQSAARGSRLTVRLLRLANRMPSFFAYRSVVYHWQSLEFRVSAEIRLLVPLSLSLTLHRGCGLIP